jgi:polar amino acid transport system substrate-binding protein
MAAAMVGEGTSYTQLTYTLKLSDEEYGVGFRKGSDLADELNSFFTLIWADGTMSDVAALYGVQAAILPQE